MKKTGNNKSATREALRASNGIIIEHVPDADADKPLTAKELASLKRVKTDAVLSPPQKQAMNEFITKKLRGRPLKADKKKDVKLRIDPDVLKALRSTGKGWQTRINSILRQWVEKRI